MILAPDINIQTYLLTYLHIARVVLAGIVNHSIDSVDADEDRTRTVQRRQSRDC